MKTDCGIGFVSNAEEVASLVLDQAMIASDQGTFAVGGCIIENRTGKVLHVGHNNVIRPTENGKSIVYDYTAHGEHSIVQWYFAHKSLLSLPSPDELTIVTTLDPCIMCTGSLIEGGFNVGIIAPDYHAGVSYGGRFDLSSLTDPLHGLAKQKFGYYACGDVCSPLKYRRDYYAGSMSTAFHESKVTGRSLMGCQEVFSSSAFSVRDKIVDNNKNVNGCKNPATLPENSPIKLKFREVYPDAFKIQITNPGLPDYVVHNLLKKTLLCREGYSAENAVALLDTFGNVILCLADDFEKSPVHTAFMRAVQMYGVLSFELSGNVETQQLVKEYLCGLHDLMFVFLYAPSPNKATTIMDLGIYGNSMEGITLKAFPPNLQYFNLPRSGGIRQLSENIIQLPPFYRNKISFVQVAS